MLERLIAQDDSPEIAGVLAEAYFTSGPEIHQDRDLRTRIIERVARAPATRFGQVLSRFPAEEVAPMANSAVGTTRSNLGSEAWYWLRVNPYHLDSARLREKILYRTAGDPFQLDELVFLALKSLDVEDLDHLADDVALLSSRGPDFGDFRVYSSQAAIAIFGLCQNQKLPQAEGGDRILLRILDRFLSGAPEPVETSQVSRSLMSGFMEADFPADEGLRRELAKRLARLIDTAAEHREAGPTAGPAIMGNSDWKEMRAWVKKLDPAATRRRSPRR